MYRLSNELTEKSIDEVCSENNISLKQLFDRCIRANPAPRTQNKMKRKYKSTGEPYIHYLSNRFYVRKWLDGKTVSFGAYATLEEAIKLRDYLVLYNWKKPSKKQLEKIFEGG